MYKRYLLPTHGGEVVPQVSNDSSVQSGYKLGYRIGRAIGQTIEDCGVLFREVKSWF